MFPVIFYIGGHPVRAWGLLVALGIMAGLWLATKLAKKENIESDKILDFVLYALVAGILGARLWEVAFSWENFSSNPLDAIKFWTGGLSIQGAVAAGFITGILYTAKHKLSIWKFSDVLAPGLIVGQAIGRIGCLLNGDAYGIPTTLPIGIVYKEGTMAYEAYGSQPLFPAEVLEAIADITILFILLKIFKKKPFDGAVALSYFVLYSLTRFILEFWRADSLMVLGGIKAAQLTTLVTAILAFTLMLYRFKRKAKPSN